MKKILIFVLMIPVVMNYACSDDVVYESEYTRDEYGRTEIKQDVQATDSIIENLNVETDNKTKIKEKVLLREAITKDLPDGFYSGMQWKLAGKYASSFFSQWLDSWRSLNVEYYLSHYSTSFNNDEYDYMGWAERKRKLSKDKTYIRVHATSVNLLKHPEKYIMVATFLLDYRSNNYSDESWKRQYWVKEDDGRWHIVYEGVIEGPFEPFLERFNNQYKLGQKGLLKNIYVCCD